MVTFTNMHGLFYNFWYTTLQMNTNHTGKFTTLSACTSLTWWRNVDVTEIMPFTVHVTLSPCCIERRQEFIPPEMWPPNLPDLNLVDYSIWGILQERVYRSQIHDVKELKERLLGEYEGCRTTPSSWQRLRSGVVVWMNEFAWMVDNWTFLSLWLSAVFYLFHRHWFL